MGLCPSLSVAIHFEEGKDNAQKHFGWHDIDLVKGTSQEVEISIRHKIAPRAGMISGDSRPMGKLWLN